MKVFKTTIKLLLGIVIIVAVPVLLFLLLELLSVHNFITLKWYPLISCFIGFLLAGLVNRKTDLRLLPVLFLGLAIYKPLMYLFFPFILLLLLFAVVGLLISRSEVKKPYRLGTALLATALLGYFLFSQPLIITLDGFGTNVGTGDLVNARVIWGMSNQKPPTLPDEAFIDRDGNRVRLDEFRGKDLYITFWATWCGPCLSQKPDLAELIESMEEENSDMIFISISIDGDSEAWHNYLEENNPPGIHLISANEYRTRSNFRFDGIPFNIIANKEGLYKHVARPMWVTRSMLTDSSEIDRYIQTPIEVR